MQGECLAERRVGRSLLLPVLATWECCVSQMKILGNVYDFLISCHGLHHLPRLPPAPHRLAPSLRDPGHHPNNERLYVTRRRHSSRTSRLFSPFITNFHHSRQTTRRRTCFRVMSSTAAATLRQLVMFVVIKVVQEDHRMVLSNERESITLPNRLPPATRLLSSRTSVY
jgi:hypothetical protein